MLNLSEGKIGRSRAIPRLEITPAEVLGRGFDRNAYRREMYRPRPPKLVPQLPPPLPRLFHHIEAYGPRQYNSTLDFIGPCLPVNFRIARQILVEVSAKYDVTREDILGRSRAHRFIRPRHEAMYRLRHETTWSWPHIGRFLGGRDHSTALSGAHKHAERLGKCPSP